MRHVRSMFLVIITLVALTPAAFAATKISLKGNWNVSVSEIATDGAIRPESATLTITNQYSTTGLFFGTLTSGERVFIMTGQVDAGNTFHFAISGFDTGQVPEIDPPKSLAFGRGTLSAKSFTGTYNNNFGDSGTIVGTKKK